jgi:arginase
MQICLIQVPYMLGDERHGASMGVQRYAEAGVDLLVARGAGVAVERIERGVPFRDSASASLAINKRLAPVVQQAITAKQWPLVLAGSCDVSMGILSGFDHSRCGVVWFDAHGDFNTPESTITGFFGGMSLAVITGHCYRTLWAQVGNSAPIAEAATLMLGVRDLDPEERMRLDRSAIQVVHWREGKPHEDVLASLDRLAERVQEVYLHFDLDAVDPQVAPGIVDFPVPGGLSLLDIEEAIRAIGARLRVRAAALTTYNPGLDREERTFRLGQRIMELLAECASLSNAP